MKFINLFLIFLLLTQTSIFANADEFKQTGDQFDFQLFQQVNKESVEEKNVLVSPFSLSMLLSMVLNNSSEEAQNDFKKLLGVSGLSVEQINQNSKNVMEGTSIKSRKLAEREKPKKILLAFGSEWSRI